MKNDLKKQTEIEKIIIDARLQGASIYEMEEKEWRIAADQIILKCSVITGCELPFTDFFAAQLSETIIEYINEMGYGDLSLKEIILAMKLNLPNRHKLPGGIELQEINFSGRCVNITFISKILWNYMVIRNHIDRRFQNMIDGYSE